MLRWWWSLSLAAVACGRIDFVSHDSGVPDSSVAGVMLTINHGSPYAIAPMLELEVAVAGWSPIEIQVAQAGADGDCNAVFGSTWQPYAAPAMFLRHVSPVDGTKVLCAWGRDAAGNVVLGQSSIDYATHDLPIITQLSVTDAGGGRTFAAGDPLHISWTVTDTLGLAPEPIDLYYAADPLGQVWQPLALATGNATATPFHYSDAITNLAAPTSQAFRVKLVARDVAGNRGIAALSDVANLAGWSVYAGSSDDGIGGVGRGAELHDGETNLGAAFAIDPTTYDIYANDDARGISKLDARTGEVSMFAAYGAPNLLDDGPLPASPTLLGHTPLHFGPDGRLYLAELAPTSATSDVIYQIDLAAGTSRRYLGGGTVNDASGTAATTFIYAELWTFDEDGTLYFFTRCAPGVYDRTLSAVRMMKVTQNADGTPGQVSIVAGDCTRGTPPVGPSDALTVPVGAFEYEDIGTLAAWNHGDVIYFASYGTGAWKIVGGQLSASDIAVADTGSLTYDATRGVLAATNQAGAIVAYTPNLASPNGDVALGTIVAADGTGACTNDGTLATSACVHVGFTVASAPDGALYFEDGPALNEERPYRIRFVDDDGLVRTYFGSPPFYGNGLDRRLARGTFAGIYAKQASEPAQLAFPAAVYFVDFGAPLFAHIDASDRVVIDAGNSSGVPVTLATGTPIGPDLGLGISYAGGTMFSLTFDATGLPWMRYGPESVTSWLVSVDTSRDLVVRQTGGPGWELAPDGADPAAFDTWPYTFYRNLTIDGEAAVAIGGYVGHSSTATIKLLDFAAHSVTRLIGQPGNTASPDIATPGGVIAASLSSTCFDTGPCWVQYRAADDRLYFIEDLRLRYITHPATPASSTLGTLWTRASGGALGNFTFSLDGSQLFYLLAGQLQCHDISSGKPWCNDTGLGPATSLLAIQDGPNQLAWLDAQTLLVSSFAEAIYAFTLPP